MKGVARIGRKLATMSNRSAETVRHPPNLGDIEMILRDFTRNMLNWFFLKKKNPQLTLADMSEEIQEAWRDVANWPHIEQLEDRSKLVEEQCRMEVKK